MNGRHSEQNVAASRHATAPAREAFHPYEFDTPHTGISAGRIRALYPPTRNVAVTACNVTTCPPPPLNAVIQQ
jgi:hypothetical protein